jgi:hypothetical protein
MRKVQYQIGLLCLLLLGACSGQATPAPQPAPDLSAALPAVAALDSLQGGGGRGVSGAALRRTSATQNQGADVTAPVASGFGSAGVSVWNFSPQAAAHSWAVYRIPAPQAGSTLLSLQAQGGTKLWMLSADYGTGRWVARQMGSGPTQVSLQAGGPWVSPGGYVYCAFVLPAGSAGGAQLSGLNLQYDDGLSSGPQYYVATPANGGSDGNDGSQAHPWATLQHAADVVQAGDTVNVTPGSYVGFMVQTSGSAGNPIVFNAQPGAKIVDTNNHAPNGHTPDGINIENWDAPPAISYVVVQGFTINGDDFPTRPRTGIRTACEGDTPADQANHITIRNNTITNCDEWGILTGHVDNMLIEGNECAGSKVQHGIYYSNASAHTTIRGNICHDNADCGIHTNGDLSSGGTGIISDVLFEANIVYNNGASGGSAINSDGVQSSTYRNNLIFGNHASGISLYDIDAAAPATNDFITNNTIVMASDARWCLNIQDASTGATVRNNILLNDNPSHGAIDISSDSLSGFTSDYNAVKDRFTPDDNTFVTLAQWQSQTGQDAHSFVATDAELFVVPNPLQPVDFKLSLTSLALNAGGVQNAPPTDILGNPRPAHGKYDIGCYEMQ